MSKRWLFCICILLSMSLTACGTSSASSHHVDQSSPTVSTAAVQAYDVDLTALSSTMVYAEVYNMTTVPDSFIGKSVKMNGVCDVYHDETTGKTYYACIIQDATACCASGIEFELAEGNYPNKGDEVTVAGTFETYEEGGGRYAILRNATRIA